METIVQNLEAVFAAGGRKVVGAFCYWSLSNVEVNRQLWRDTMESIGLGRAVGREPRAEAMLSDAAHLARSGADGILLRRVDRYSWGIIEEVRGESDNVLSHSHDLTLTVQPSAVPVGQRVLVFAVAGAPVAGDQAQRVAAKMVAACENIAQNVLTTDLSTMLTTAMHGSTVRPMLGAISLRDRTGGLYLLPPGSVVQAKALAAAVNALAGGSRVDVLTLYADDENLATAAQSAKASFTAQLNVLREELAAFQAEAKGATKDVTDRNVDVRLGRLNSLDQRVSMWSEVLGDVRAELVASIEAAKADVVAALGL